MDRLKSKFLQLAEDRKARFLALAAVFFFLQTALFGWNEKYFWLFAMGVSGALIVFIDYQYFWYLGLGLFAVSLNMKDYVESAAIVFPSDLLAIALMLILFFRWGHYWPDLNRALRHPMALTFGLYLLWMLATTVTSVRPVVSIKYWLSSVWYFFGFYVFTVLFLKRRAELFRSWAVILLPLTFVVVYTILKHALKGFSIAASYEIMQPFYKEHTAYAASIAFFVPAFFLFAFRPGQKFWVRALWLGAAGVVFLGVLFSYTRGAWLGLVASAAALVFLFLWKRYKPLVIIGLVVAGMAGGLLSQTDFYFTKDADKRNKSVSDRILSAFNTKTDLSNRERFNRWTSAVGMMQEKPLVGFGPGTYAMEYAPYQQARYRTLVSTNQGDIGSTHNEFLLAGSEMGIPGLLLVLLFYSVSLYCGARGYLRARNVENRLLYGAALAGLVTYYVHAVVNNFLDQDKVCIPAFLCMAVIIALDVFHREDNAAGETEE